MTEQQAGSVKKPSAHDPKFRVAVIGLGSMGSGMAGSLINAGFAVHGSDLDGRALEALQRAGGSVAANPAEAARGADAVVCVVINSQQTEAVLFDANGCADAMRPGSVFISCATLAPDAARQLAKRLEANEIHYLDAPISGGAKRASEGALTILASGSEAAFSVAVPALDAMAKTQFRLGSQPGQASAFKIVNQLLAGVHIAAASEAMAFAAAQGLDLKAVYEVITQSAGNSWMFEDRMRHVIDDDYTPRSMVNIFVKDLGIVLDIARSRDIPVPIASTALQMFLMTAAAGMGRDDDASVARLYSRLTGRPLSDPKKLTAGETEA